MPNSNNSKLSSLSDSELVSLTKQKVMLERQSALEVIECLREIFQRRVHLTLSYPSLHIFCVRELGYSDSEAYTRPSALNLLEEVPETRRSLGDGTLSLTKAAQIQTFLKRQEKRKASLEHAVKQNIVESLQDLSGREIERELVNLGLELGDSEIAKREQARPAGPDSTELKIYLPNQTMEKLEKLKSLLSHKNPNASYAELIDQVAEIALDKLDPERLAQRKAPGSSRRNSEIVEFETIEVAAPRARRSRYIPQKTRREVWRAAQGQCQFRPSGLEESRVCGSQHKLQIEHKVPWAMGGSNDPENLTLLCAAHNLHRAKEVFGAVKIESHIRGSPVKVNFWERGDEPVDLR